jgi:hypothetical protein
MKMRSEGVERKEEEGKEGAYHGDEDELGTNDGKSAEADDGD